ncbi:conserved hypothetical protein [Verticillium alfalfae VaMs.102]|uniref:Pheromone-regulated membrane protein n=1 Tax=Verticillium alfalfae (strain VaMs.102 / ATCC MYA-4576 / FGSC 10136) TaxID=526221 RepID=C9SSZ0_VERA1|nr:conserved hypothetical protein [Verticillium alfalfae VaMs.102]EEY21905.1 conserved hypothetical protein [Verticillium alfalfae VaMs.102]
MGCCTNRRKVVEARPEQKWDYINLNDFKSKGCATPFAYGYLWFMLIISIAVYGVDTFTAVNLLVFNKWSGEIDPAIDFEISKWIFSICIIASFVNLGFEQLRAMRVMKRGNIAECYLDNIAVRLESIRLGKRQGYRRFLVFAELTKSKKGGQYIALFTYFSFQSWIRVLLCSGPRQAINALTLKSVYEVKLSSDGGGNVGQEILSFFEKIKELATQDTRQAVILSGMLFTLVVWIFSALFLLAAVLFYVFFLWHWIPRADGGLSGYCERKVNKSLTKIVHEKVDKALAKEERKQLKAGVNGIEKPILGRQATLPTLPNLGEPGKVPDMPQLDRKDTMTTLPPYTSRPASPGSIELGQMDRKRPMPPRTTTMSSTASYNSNAALMGNSADMGYATPLPSGNAMAPPNRPGTSNSHRTGGRPPLDAMSAHGSSLRNNITESPSAYSADTMPPFPAPVRSMTGRTFDTYDGGRSSPAPNRPAYGEYPLQSDGRASPAPSIFSDRSAAPSSARAGASSGSFQPYQPGRGATGPVPNRGPGSHYTPSRNMTAPMPPRVENDYFTRPGTSQSHRPNPRGPDRGYDTYNADPESQRDARY